MYVCMAEIEPAPEPAPEYVYVEPYHHAITTKHGANNWSWTKLWQAVHGQLPNPLRATRSSYTRKAMADYESSARRVPVLTALVVILLSALCMYI